MADNGKHIWSIFSNSLFATATATDYQLEVGTMRQHEHTAMLFTCPFQGNQKKPAIRQAFLEMPACIYIYM